MEAVLDLDGLRVDLVDTAGVRETVDRVEARHQHASNVRAIKTQDRMTDTLLDLHPPERHPPAAERHGGTPSGREHSGLTNDELGRCQQLGELRRLVAQLGQGQGAIASVIGARVSTPTYGDFRPCFRLGPDTDTTSWKCGSS